MEYLSVAELSEITGIPRTTVRRWLKEYEEFFITDLDGERVVYHPQTLADLSWVQKRREEGMPLIEIKATWIKKVIHSVGELEEENVRLDRIASFFEERRNRWSQKYTDLVSRAENANLWQRIFKTW